MRTSWPMSCSSMREAVRRVAVVVDDEDAPGTTVRRARRRTAALRRSERLRPDRSGRRTTNSLPWPRPVAVAASTVPPCISTRRFTSVRPMPSPPARALERAVDLREHVEDARQLVGGDADAVVVHADDGLVALPARP